MIDTDSATHDRAATVSVLLIEHQDQFETTEFFARSAFAAIGYDIAVKRVDASQLVIDNKKSNPLFNEAYDCVVSDISWGADIESAQGLSAIRYFRRHWPDLLVIGCSRSQLTYPQVAIKQPSFHLFWYKPEFTNKKVYLPVVSSELRQCFKRNVNVSFDHAHSKVGKEWDKPVDRLELTGLLRQLTFTGHRLDDAIGNIALHSLSGGFSKARVYRMESKTVSGAECVSTVVKISDPEGAARELENYQAFVKWGLPFKWRPELLGSAFTANYGAVCYSFVEASPAGFTSLNDLIAANECLSVLEVIKSIFDPQQQQWYHSRNVRRHRLDNSAGGLTGYYRDRWFPDASMIVRANAALKDFGRRHGWDLSRADTVSIDDRIVRLPEIALLGQIRFDYHTCVRHGDLHGGNIIVSHAGQSCFIDFQESGRGHVFEDFVVFEGSLRLHYRSGLSLAESFERERLMLSAKRIAEGVTEVKDAIQLSVEVRERARDSFPDEGWANYVYALGLFCFRLMRIDDLEEWQREQIVACMLACICHLEK
jgi:hypothetical protein